MQYKQSITLRDISNLKASLGTKVGKFFLSVVGGVSLMDIQQINALNSAFKVENKTLSTLASFYAIHPTIGLEAEFNLASNFYLTSSVFLDLPLMFNGSTIDNGHLVALRKARVGPLNTIPANKAFIEGNYDLSNGKIDVGLGVGIRAAIGFIYEIRRK